MVATHPEGLSIIYSLGGADAAHFTVDRETGQIRVKEGVELSPGQTYSLTLTATDSAGFGAMVIVTIEVSEASQRPYDLNGDNSISLDELLAAVEDYLDGNTTREELIDLIKRYFAQ